MPGASFRDGAQPFLQGECVLIRFADPISVDQGLDVSTSAGSISTLSPTPAGGSPQHWAFIRSSLLLENGSYEVTAYPIVSFTHSGGALAGYNALPPNEQARLIPLPPLWDHHPTPPLFGNRFDLGDFTLKKDSWLLVNPQRFIISEDKTFKRWNPKVCLTHSEMHQIDVYRNALPPATANNRGGRGGPSGRRSNINRGQRGRGGRHDGGSAGQGGQGHGASGDSSGPRTRNQTRARARGGGNSTSRKAGEKVARTALEPEMLPANAVKQWGDLVVEDVDDDTQDADATYKHELMLLAGPGDSGFCRNELVKLLQAEQKEREEMQQQRVARVRQWQQTMAPPS